MTGKTVLITGANSGIGKATAWGLAKLGAQVVMLCRSEVRGEAARKDIMTQTGNNKVDLMICNLASQKSIRKFVRDFEKKYNRLDVLINNAGVNLFTRTIIEDGYETTFATNHLGHFLLTNLLLRVLKKSAPARIVNVSSSAQREIDFDDVMNPKNYKAMWVYPQSKMANMLFTYELASRLEGTGVTVNALHPGGVRTNLARDFRGFFKYFIKVMWPFLSSPEKGAETSIYLASSTEVEGITGKYFGKCKETRSSPASYDRDSQKRLWELSVKLTKLEMEG